MVTVRDGMANRRLRERKGVELLALGRQPGRVTAGPVLLRPARPDDGPVVAEVEGAVVGVLALSEGWIDQLHLTPEFRGRGIGEDVRYRWAPAGSPPERARA